jgi:hypothetical protein
MFERVSQFAEQAATNLSRRQMLGRLGQGALALAGVLGAMLVAPTAVQADPGSSEKCCNGLHCAPPRKGCHLVNDCYPAGRGVTACLWNCQGDDQVTVICS